MRANATSSPSTSTQISTTTNSLTSSQKPSSTSGNDALKSSQLKNVSFTFGQPSLVTIDRGEQAEHHDRRDGRDGELAPVAAPVRRLAGEAARGGLGN